MTILNEADTFLHAVCETFAVRGCSVFDRRSGKLFRSFSDREELVSWFSSYLYYAFYANDKAMVQRITLGRSTAGSVFDLEDANVVGRVIDGCDHSYCEDASWRLVSNELKEMGGEEYYEVTNGSARVYELARLCLFVGDGLIIRADPIQRHLASGWICITGGSGNPVPDEGNIFRFYHSFSPQDDLREVVNCVTRPLNDRGIRYRLKVANNPSGLARNDALVLYTECLLDSSAMEEVNLGFKHSPDEYAVPPMTKRSVWGWGIAFEQIGGGSLSSYGQRCCRVAARAVAKAGDVELAVSEEIVLRELSRAILEVEGVPSISESES